MFLLYLWATHALLALTQTVTHSKYNFRFWTEKFFAKCFFYARAQTNRYPRYAIAWSENFY